VYLIDVQGGPDLTAPHCIFDIAVRLCVWYGWNYKLHIWYAV